MNAKKIAIAVLGTALLAGASIPAFAAPGRPGPGGPDGPGGRGHGFMQDVTFIRLLKSADSNKDGKISKDEMGAWRDQLFTQIDANKDGTLTRGELLDYRTAKMEEFRKNNPPPEQADKSDDKHGPAMDNADKDDHHGSGRDDRGWHGRHAHGPRGHDRDRREARNYRHGPMMQGHGPMGPRFFRMIDEDKDGKINKAEATAATDKLFAFMDTNKDGQISIDDLPDRPL